MLLSFLLFEFPSIVLNILLRYDCYESFTKPVIYLNLSHFYPSGPLFITTQFHYMRYFTSIDSLPQLKQRWHGFKRVNISCNSSILFTLMEENFVKLDLKIFIYLIKFDYQIAYISYKFYKGYNPGYYTLLSVDQSFGLNLEIFDVGEYYLGPYLQFLEKERFYINSISQGTGELCINTENNPAAVLEPKYTDGPPAGYVTAFQIEMIRDNKEIETKNYSTFECHMHKNYPKEPIIMITDRHQYETIFKVFYWKYIDGKLHSSLRKFEILHQIYDNVNNLKNISPRYKIIFLMKSKWLYEKCSDASAACIHLSKEGVRYFATKILFLNITAGVEMCLKRIRNPLDPCHE